MNICIATIPSMNICIKAQKALSENMIFCKIVSIDPKLTKRGCAYGIEFSCSEQHRMKSILRRAGIHPSQFLSSEELKSR